jgi:hypothetical protein
MMADGLGQGRVRSAGKNFETLVVHATRSDPHRSAVKKTVKVLRDKSDEETPWFSR